MSNQDLKSPLSPNLRFRILLAAFFASGLSAIVLLNSATAWEDVVLEAEEPKKDLSGTEQAETKFPGGAGLKTDPDLESALSKAELLANDGSYSRAAKWWQYVLNESGDTLVTRDGRKYVSLVEDVERTIAKLPPGGLRIFRIEADGNAHALLAESTDANREDALSEVVRKYFISSLGDDAAYELGCIALDRYDFVGASRLFTKVLQEHPDPSVPRSQILLRLAVATAHLGDSASAQQALSDAKAADDGLSSELLALVTTDVEQAGKHSGVKTRSTGDWNLRWGGTARDGRMQPLSEGVTKASLTKMWEFSFPLDFSMQALPNNAVFLHRGSRTTQQATVSNDVKSMAKNWRMKNWRPTGQLLMSSDRVYVKTNNDLTCWNMSADSERPIWRTAWLNKFQVDTKSLMMQQMRANMGGQGAGAAPVAPVEVMLFGDRIHQSMSISGDMIFNLEGKRVDRHGGGSGSTTQRQTRTRWNYGVLPRRTRGNSLAAYDARTGKVKWYRSAAEKEEGGESEQPNTEIGFMSAPVPYGNLLLTPLTDGGTIWLYALDRFSGDTVWKSYLCDEPAGGCNAWAPVGVSVDGRDAYVVCGAGVVFAVDAASGTIRFAIRYRRDGKPNDRMRQMGFAASGLMDLRGWDDDMAVPYGRALVVMASDHDQLFAVDRRSGKLLWTSPRTPLGNTASYFLGMHDGSFFVGGRKVVRRYDVNSGKLKWETEVTDAQSSKESSDSSTSFGRGLLTDDAIYVPVNSAIVRLDLETGQITDTAPVAQTTGEPIGNLFSDGEKIWVVGGNRVYALTNLQQRLEVLSRRIKEGDPQAYLERMKLSASENKLDSAIEDLRSAFALLVDQSDVNAAALTLLENLREIDVATQAPRKALQVIVDCVGKDVDSSEDVKSLRRDLLATALRTIRTSESALGATPEILAVVPLLAGDYQLAIARQALAKSATENDLAALEAAVNSDDKQLANVVVPAYVHIANEEAKPQLQKLISSDDESLRLVAASALANLKDRSSLDTLTKLLDAEDARVRARSVNALRKLTGQNFGYTAYADVASRTKSRDAWLAWLEEHRDDVELKLPLTEGEPLLGRTLIAYYGRNLIVELDQRGEKVWEKHVLNPWACQGLPNGHRLVASYSRNEIIEFDEKGNEVWRKSNLPGNPFSVTRLDNGNTLVACSNSQRVVEYKPDGNIAWQATVSNRPVDAERLPNGNTLVALSGSGQVVEVNEKGAVVWRANNLSNAFSVQRLENGNTLVAQSTGRVVEVDREGKVVWEKTGISQPYDAQRLPNGNTIIAANNAVMEVSASDKDKVIWQRRENGASGVSRY